MEVVLPGPPDRDRAIADALDGLIEAARPRRSFRISRVDRTWQYPNRVCAAQGPIVMIDPVRRRTLKRFVLTGDGRWSGGSLETEIRQWLPEHLAAPSEDGLLEAFTKLDATLISAQAVGTDHRGVVAWPS